MALPDPVTIPERAKSGRRPPPIVKFLETVATEGVEGASYLFDTPVSSLVKGASPAAWLERGVRVDTRSTQPDGTSAPSGRRYVYATRLTHAHEPAAAGSEESSHGGGPVSAREAV